MTTWEPCIFPPQVKGGASGGEDFEVVEGVLKTYVASWF